MLRLLKILWPALIPLLLHVMYALWRSRRRARGQTVPHIPNSGFYSVVASLLIAIALFLMLGIEQTPRHGAHYEPTHMNPDGSLAKGKVE